MPPGFLMAARVLALVKTFWAVLGPMGLSGLAGKKPGGRTMDLPVVPQFLEQVQGEDGIAVLLPLAVSHPDHHAVAVDVTPPR